jgi:hypothetical protein
MTNDEVVMTKERINDECRMLNGEGESSKFQAPSSKENGKSGLVCPSPEATARLVGVSPDLEKKTESGFIRVNLGENKSGEQVHREIEEADFRRRVALLRSEGL